MLKKIDFFYVRFSWLITNMSSYLANQNFNLQLLSQDEITQLNNFIQTELCSFDIGEYDFHSGLDYHVKIGYHVYQITNRQTRPEDKIRSIRQIGLLYDSMLDIENAFRWFEIGANRKEAHCQYKLGIYYEHGHHDYGNPDYDEAKKWYELSSRQGHEHSFFRLGLFYEEGKAVQKDINEAIKYYKCAEGPKPEMSRSRDATLKLAKLYENRYIGNDQETNNFEAYIRFKILAYWQDENGYSLYKVGLFNELGIVPGYSERNLENALKYYMKSSEKGFDLATLKVALFYEKGKIEYVNYKKAFEWYKKSADSGSAYGMYELGLLYQYGMGVEQDIDTAISLYKKGLSAEANQTDKRGWLEHQMGTLYEEGYKKGAMIIVPKDISTALTFYEKSAGKNNGASIIRLGILALKGINPNNTPEFYFKKLEEKSIYGKKTLANLYLEGGEVPINVDEAERLIRIDVDDEKESTSMSIGKIHEKRGEILESQGKIEESKEEYKNAFGYYERCIKEEGFHCLTRLGFMYDIGHFVEIDHKKAREYYNLSIGKRHFKAYYYLGFQEESGFNSKGKPDLKKALEFYQKGADILDHRSCLKIAQFHENGLTENGEILITPDADQAIFWYRRSAKGLNIYAMARLRELN